MRISLTLFAAMHVVPELGCGDSSNLPMDGASDPNREIASDAADGAWEGPCSPFVSGTCGSGLRCAMAHFYDRSTQRFVDARPVCVGGGTLEEGAECRPALSCGENGGDGCFEPTPEDPSDWGWADDCQEGLFCLRRMRGAPSYCLRLCSRAARTCAAGEVCVEQGATSTGMTWGSLCEAFSTCDPAFQTGCMEGQGCYITPDGRGAIVGVCDTPTAHPDGRTRVAGDACELAQDCPASLQCANGVCHQLCNLSSAAGLQCAVPEQCVEFTTGLKRVMLPTPTGVCR